MVSQQGFGRERHPHWAMATEWGSVRQRRIRSVPGKREQHIQGPGVQTEDGGRQPRLKLLLGRSLAEGPWVRDGASHASVSLSAAGPPYVIAMRIK